MKHTTETQPDTPALDALKTLHAGFDAAGSRMVAALLGTQQSFQVAKEKILMGMQRDSKQMNTGKR
jgi:hypothetical protein